MVSDSRNFKNFIESYSPESRLAAVLIRYALCESVLTERLWAISIARL